LTLLFPSDQAARLSFGLPTFCISDRILSLACGNVDDQFCEVIRVADPLSCLMMKAGCEHARILDFKLNRCQLSICFDICHVLGLAWFRVFEEP